MSPSNFRFVIANAVCVPLYRSSIHTVVLTAAPVTLPPSIIATKTFRCADNSEVSVDFYGDNASAAVHQKEGPPIALKAPAAGQP